MKRKSLKKYRRLKRYKLSKRKNKKKCNKYGGGNSNKINRVLKKHTICIKKKTLSYFIKQLGSIFKKLNNEKGSIDIKSWADNLRRIIFKNIHLQEDSSEFLRRIFNVIDSQNESKLLFDENNSDKWVFDNRINTNYLDNSHIETILKEIKLTELNKIFGLLHFSSIKCVDSQGGNDIKNKVYNLKYDMENITALNLNKSKSEYNDLQELLDYNLGYEEPIVSNNFGQPVYNGLTTDNYLIPDGDEKDKQKKNKEIIPVRDKNIKFNYKEETKEAILTFKEDISTFKQMSFLRIEKKHTDEKKLLLEYEHDNKLYKIKKDENENEKQITIHVENQENIVKNDVTKNINITFFKSLKKSEHKCNSFKKKEIYKPISKYIILYIKIQQSKEEGTQKLKFTIKDLEKQINLNNNNYNIISFNVHIGASINSGHYITYRKYKEEWYRINDPSSTKFNDKLNIDEKETPMIFLYEKTKTETDDGYLINNEDIKIFKENEGASEIKINGIENISDQCFLNSIIQLLAACPWFVYYMKNLNKFKNVK